MLHAIGFQTFDGGATSGVSDNTPDSNSTFDTTPVGSNSNGSYLTAILGAGASNLGRNGLGVSGNNGFLQGADFGSTLDIVDVPLANGFAGSRIDLQGQPGATSWSFQTNGNQEFGDFSVTNQSDFAFRLEDIHFDARSGAANSPQDLDLIYLASGSSNLIRASTGTEVPDLHQIINLSFPTRPGVQNVSAGLAGSFNTPTAVRLFPGDTASFRFRWTNSNGAFAQSQIDNLAISGTFQDQNNGFALIDPVAQTAVVPEPSGMLLLTVGCAIAATRRRRLG